MSRIKIANRSVRSIFSCRNLGLINGFLLLWPDIACNLIEGPLYVIWISTMVFHHVWHGLVATLNLARLVQKIWSGLCLCQVESLLYLGEFWSPDRVVNSLVGSYFYLLWRLTLKLTHGTLCLSWNLERSLVGVWKRLTTFYYCRFVGSSPDLTSAWSPLFFKS